MDASFTAISSNIRFSTNDDGPHRWENRRHLLAKTILSHQPAVVATQEGREPQLRELAKLLQPLQFLDKGRPWIEERMYPCLFVDPDQVTVLENGDFWLSNTPNMPGSVDFNSMFPRLCAWARLLINGKTWLVTSTHLDHVLSETREKQAQVLATEIKKRLNPQDDLLIMGDFNDSPSSLAREVLKKNFPALLDPWNHEEESSHHPFTGECTTGSRIDWILISANTSRTEIFLDKSNDQNHWPSDHFPVVCRIKT